MNTEGNMFELVTRNKIRIPSIKGPLSVEQLWEVPLRSKDGFDLDAIAKLANKELKLVSEESFVATERKSSDQSRMELVLDLVKYIISVKLDEEAAAAKRADNKKEREQLLGILAEKKLGALSELSEKELQKRIKSLEGGT